MDKIKVMIVDDSPFSQTIIKNSLDPKLFEVCGTADTGQEAIDLYHKLNPDIVTMDITMPDMGGIECSKKILALDSKARIVVLSSLRHDSLVTQGRSVGIRCFLQKPVNQEELCQVLLKVYNSDNKDESWQEQFLKDFSENVGTSFSNATRLKCEVGEVKIQDEKFVSAGITTIFGLTGDRQGRLFVDTDRECAAQLTKRMLNKEIDENDTLNCLAELANIICGHIISKFNNNSKGIELNITPPSILFGQSINIINRKYKSYFVTIKTELGTFKISVGFAGGV